MSTFNDADICKEINTIILNGISKKDEEIRNLKDTIRKMEEKMKSMDDSTTIKQKEKFFDEQMKRYFEKEREVDERMEEYKKEFIPSSLLQEEIEELRNERDNISSLLREENKKLRNEKRLYVEEMNNRISVYESDNETLKKIIYTHKSDLQDKNRMIALLQDKINSVDKNIVTKYNILKESYESLESNSREQISNLNQELNEAISKLNKMESVESELEKEKREFNEEKKKFELFKQNILELIE